MSKPLFMGTQLELAEFPNFGHYKSHFTQEWFWANFYPNKCLILDDTNFATNKPMWQNTVKHTKKNKEIPKKYTDNSIKIPQEFNCPVPPENFTQQHSKITKTKCNFDKTLYVPLKSLSNPLNYYTTTACDAYDI